MHVDPEEIRRIVESAALRTLFDQMELDCHKVLLSKNPVGAEEIEEARRDWLALSRLRQKIQAATKKVG